MEIITDKIHLIWGDCLKKMDGLIARGIKVDAIITDPPYGTTSCSWDYIIPFNEMWPRLNELIKTNGAILLFGAEPFSSELRVSNLKNYKYDLIWKKSKCGSALTAKYKPLSKHENISVFERKGKKTTYNPQMEEGKPYKREYTLNKSNNLGYGVKGAGADNRGTRFPGTILDFPQQWRRQDQTHPAQKPIALMEYLIKTYTNGGGVVLDFTMGSGSTGVACMNTGRAFIGIELDPNYYGVACERILNARPLLTNPSISVNITK